MASVAMMNDVGAAQRPLYLGFDVGGTSIKLGIVDDHGRAIADTKISTEEERGPRDAVKRARARVDELLKGLGLTIADLAAVGLCVPGTMDIPKGLFLQPHNPPAHPEAVRAILEADLIILGPGSLYTSVLPNILVDGVKRSILASSAPKVYICNVATQHGETDGFNVADHLRTMEEHIGKGIINYVLANDNLPTSIPKAPQSEAVRLDAKVNNGIRLVQADVISEENRYHHDSERLAQAVMRIYYDRDQAPVPEVTETVEELAVSAVE